jgi:PAS domain-containing protein
MLRKLSIGKRLALGFGLLIVLILTLGYEAIDSAKSLGSLTEKMHRHPLAVSTNALEAARNIVKMHRTMKNIPLAKNDFEIEKAWDEVNENEKQVYKHFAVVEERFLGEKKLYQDAYDAFHNWRPIREEIYQLMRQGRRDKSAEFTKSKGAKHVRYMSQKTDALTNFARKKADEFLSNANSERNRILNVMYFLIGAIIASGLVIGYLVTKSITRPLKDITEKISEISNGHLQQEKIPVLYQDETGFLEDIYNKLLYRLNDFIKHSQRIQEGNLHEKEFDAKGEFGHSLEKMLKLAKEKKETENELKIKTDEMNENHHFKTGVHELNAFAQGENEISSLANQTLNHIINFLELPLGAIYVKNSDERLHRVTDYGYPKKQELPDSFPMDSGLIGKVATRREAISFNDFPDYVQVAFGFMEIPPKSLMMFPLLFNKELLGVLELGSFRPFTQTQTDWLNEASHVLASGIKSCMDFSKREQAEKNLRYSEVMTRSVVENAYDAIIRIDEKGLIQSFNPSAENIFGYQFNEVINKNISMLMPEPYKSEHNGYIKNYLTTGVGRRSPIVS